MAAKQKSLQIQRFLLRAGISYLLVAIVNFFLFWDFTREGIGNAVSGGFSWLERAITPADINTFLIFSAMVFGAWFLAGWIMERVSDL